MVKIETLTNKYSSFQENLCNLYIKSQEILILFNNEGGKEIRFTHINILAGQIAVSLKNLEINILYFKKHNKEFNAIFNSNTKQIDNYFYGLAENITENIVEVFLFQSELIFRFYYSKMQNEFMGKEKNLYKIFATLFNDIENNWTTKECKLLVLLWTARNVIHTGGIYYQKQQGVSLKYKNKNYHFVFGKAPEFIMKGLILDLINDLFDVTKKLFLSRKIKRLAYFEHPSYLALDK